MEELDLSQNCNGGRCQAFLRLGRPLSPPQRESRAGPCTGWSEPSFSGAPFSRGLPWSPSLSQQELRPHASEPHAPPSASPPSGTEVRANSPVSAPPRPLVCSPDPRRGPRGPAHFAVSCPHASPSRPTWPGSASSRPPEPWASSERPHMPFPPPAPTPRPVHICTSCLSFTSWFGCHLFQEASSQAAPRPADPDLPSGRLLS